MYIFENINIGHLLVQVFISLELFTKQGSAIRLVWVSWTFILTFTPFDHIVS